MNGQKRVSNLYVVMILKKRILLRGCDTTGLDEKTTTDLGEPFFFHVLK